MHSRIQLSVHHFVVLLKGRPADASIREVYVLNVLYTPFYVTETYIKSCIAETPHPGPHHHVPL